MSNLLKVADDLAALAHEGQTRKNSGIPYVSHPRQVSKMVEEVCGSFIVTRFDTLELECAKAAALLHDVIEDTEYDADKILNYLLENATESHSEEIFYTVELVNSLTDTAKHEYPMCNRKERKTLDGARISSCSQTVQLIKICDIMCNVDDYVNEDPKYAVDVYIPEKMTYVKFLVNLPIEFKRLIDNFLSQRLKIAKSKL